jgi:hypothetical protein
MPIVKLLVERESDLEARDDDGKSSIEGRENEVNVRAAPFDKNGAAFCFSKLRTQ